MTSSMIRNIRTAIINGKKARRFDLRSLGSLPAFDQSGRYIAVGSRRTYAMWLYV